MALAAATYARLIEENGAAFLLALGRAAGAEERDDEQIHWIIGNSPIDYHNAVVRFSATPANAEAAVVASLHCMQRHQVPGTWHVGPTMASPNLAELLVQHGFTYGGDDIGMAVDLAQLPTSVSTPAGFQIQPVRDQADLAVWVATLAQGFGEGPVEAEWVGAMYQRIGLAQRDTWQHYIGYLHEQPVATASLYLAAGAAGIYFVMTIPAAQRQGIGAAITLAPLVEARAMGYATGVLGASAAGFPVYQRLGFREYCRIGIYEWRATSSKLPQNSRV